MSEKMLILYRGNRLDHMYGAAIVASWTNNNHEIVRLEHGEPLPDVTGRDVFLINVVVDPDDITRMVATARVVLFAGNSVRALANLAEHDTENKVHVQTDPSHSTAVMLWTKLYGHNYPTVLTYLDEYYFNRSELPNSTHMLAALRHEPCTVENVERLMALDEDGLDSLRYLGRIAYEAHVRACSSITHTNLRYATVEGQLVPVCNAPAHCATEISRLILGNYPFSVVYYDTVRGRRYLLRKGQRSDVDICAVAARHGGKGNLNTATFTTELNSPFGIN